MSDKKPRDPAIEQFKAAFGVAQGAVEEIKRQAELRRVLGHGRAADALDATHTHLAERLESTTETREVETLARQARTAVEASIGEGMFRAVEVLLNRVQQHIDDIKSDKKKLELDSRRKKLLAAYGKMDAETPKLEIEELEGAATELLNDTLSAVPGGKQEIKDKRNNIYRAMLQARYRMQGAHSSPDDRLLQLGGFLRNELKKQIEMLHGDETGGMLQKQREALLATFSSLFDKRDFMTKQELDDLERHVMELSDEVAKAREKNPEQLRGVYQAKLVNSFDLSAASSDLDKLYGVLSMVPAEHVAHSSLSDVEIEIGTESLGDYSKRDKRIRINMAKVAKRPKLEYTYEANGRMVKQKLDTFSAATVHEVGHSIDDKAGIMAHPADESYGGWNTEETVDTVADAYFEALQAKFKGDEAKQFSKQLKNAIRSALDGQESKKPDEVPKKVWNDARDMLKTCRKLATDDKPWRTVLPIGERVFHKDNGSWLSYSLKARQKFTVRDYQWRSPVEWFAELYAVSWVAKTRHTGLPAPVAEFMYKDPQ
jgi:hypothetical protein